MKLLRLAPENTKFGFMRFRRVSYPFSAVMSIISVVMFILVGVNFGIDFAGGTLLELRATSGAADLAALRQAGESLHLGNVEVQGFGSPAEVTVRLGLQPGGDAAQQVAVNKLKDAIGSAYEVRRVEVVGPRVSGELVQSGTLGVVVSIFAVLIYLAFRFEWQFAVGAVIATMHDLLLTVGFFSVTHLEFNTTSIAAILTIVGYSLNEAVVVLDRIREVMRKYKRISTADMIDMSINAVLPRTIMTATTVFLALLALVFFGGEVIKSFSLAMMWGIFVGTYSSVFICSPILIYLGVRTENREAASGAPSSSAVAAKGKATACPECCREDALGMPGETSDGFIAGTFPIDAYGSGGFRFAGMSHKGSIIVSEAGVHAWAAAVPADITPGTLGPVLDAPKGSIELLLIGTGPDLVPVPQALRDRLKKAGIRVDAMATGAAARTYNVLIAERRRVAAALLAVA